MGEFTVAQEDSGPVRRTSESADTATALAVETVGTSMNGASPGWYYDPDDEAVYRWFDGENWTDHRTDIFTSHPPYDGEVHAGN